MQPRLLALLLLFMVVGCGGRKADAISLMVFGDPAERAAYAELVGGFQESHPGVTITLRHVPSHSAYHTRLSADFASGEPPDIFLLNYRRYAAFAAAGLLAPLEYYLQESTILDADMFYPVAMAAFRWQGQLMCLPQNMSSLVVYYNEDLFRRAAVPLPSDEWTPEEFLAAAQALTQDWDGNGIADQYGLGVEPSLYRLAPFVWMNGGSLVDDEHNPSRLALTRPPSLKGLEWFVNLRQEHGVVPGRAEEVAQDSESRFVAGTTAMYLNSRRGTPTYRTIDHFTWDIAPLPHSTTLTTVLHSDAFCIASSSEHKDAAWRFVEYASSIEGQTILAASGRTVPSLRAVAASRAFLAPGMSPSRSYVFLDSAAAARLVPILSTWEEVERAAGEEIARAFYGEIDVATAAAAAVERTREYFLLADFPR